MKLAILSASAVFVLAVTALQSGARSNDPAPPSFDRVRRIDASTPRPASRSIRLMTWNIDRGTELERVGSAMEHNPADLYLLQEVDWNTERAHERDVTADLARELHFNAVFGIEFEELSQERGHPAYTGQATLTSLPIRASRILRFERQSGFWKPRSWVPSGMPLMQRRIGSRIALVSELSFAGQLLVVYNAHLESRSAGMIQSEQIDEILSDARRYPSDTAIILGGDLNTKYLAAIFLHKLERAGFTSALGEHIQRTHRIAMALDWIYAKGPVHLENGEVRRDVKGSDHYPIYATLRR